MCPRLFLLVVGVLLLTASLEVASLEEASNVYHKPFDTHMHCSLCLAFASAVRTEMLRQQLPPSWSPEERAAYLTREDRLEGIVEDAVVKTATDYIWVDETPSSGRYWHYQTLRNSKVWKQGSAEKSRQAIESQRQQGGEVNRVNFIRMYLVGSLEDLIESYAKQNMTDIAVLRRRFCVETKSAFCDGNSLAVMVPREEVEAPSPSTTLEEL